MISDVAETSVLSIAELGFHYKFYKVTKFSKECSIRWKFFKQAPL